jgi:hypothetical protein
MEPLECFKSEADSLARIIRLSYKPEVSMFDTPAEPDVVRLLAEALQSAYESGMHNEYHDDPPQTAGDPAAEAEAEQDFANRMHRDFEQQCAGDPVPPAQSEAIAEKAQSLLGETDD